jgi:peptidoglycan/xylan/chitin deacetylase (PgdA/CDA1 family)
MHDEVRMSIVSRRVLLPPAAALGVTVAAHVAPAATWLPVLRRTCFPALAGLGRRDHVALTFDDGPDPRSTPRFLATLSELGVRATFFVLGDSVRRYPELTRRIAAEGHELAVHGWTHDWPWKPAVRAEIRGLSRAAETIYETTGQIPQWYRPPYGILTGGRLAAAARTGLEPVLWSAWGRDWTAAATPASVRRAVQRDLRGGGTVVLHDTDRNAAPGCWHATLGALPGLLTVCRAAGWSAGPLGEHWARTVEPPSVRDKKDLFGRTDGGASHPERKPPPAATRMPGA